MANLRADNLTGTGGRNAIDGSILLESDSKSRISVTNTTGLDFGTDLFTIEFWIYLLKEAPVSKNIFARSTSNSGTTGMIMWFDSNGHLEWDSAHGATGAIHTGAAIGNHMWHHIAVSRDSSNNTRLYLNGVLKGTASSDTTDIVGATNLQIASNIAGDGYYNDAYISNFRMVKGTAVYSGTTIFTPPTEKLKAIDGTILLCCQDSNDPTQEASGTGKTITGYGTLGGDKGTGNLITNALDWTGAASSKSTTMPANWTAGLGAQVQYATGGTSGGAENRMLRLYNDGNNSYIYQTIPTVIGQKYQIDLWYQAQNSSLAIKWSSGTSAAGTQNGSTQWNVGSNGTEDTQTGSFIASTTTTYFTFQIISGTDGASVYVDDIQVRAVNPKAPKVLPSVGVDAGVTFDGDIKMNSQGVMYFPTGRTEERGGYSGRMIVGGGEVNASPGTTNVIEYFNFAHFSNGVEFGDLTQARRKLASCSSSTRGIWAGGGSPGSTDRIDYVTIASVGDAIDFANLFTGVSDDSSQCFGGSNNTRGVFAGGYNNVVTIQYITIATTADAQDFGDLITGRFDHAGFASPTRAIFAGGKSTPAGNYNSIEYVTIATTGGGTDFGDMTAAVRGPAGLSNNIRGLMGGGLTPTLLNNIEYVTIATTGNAQDFGDLHQTRQEILAGGTSNNTRGVWAGGQQPAYVTKVDMVMIATTGNAVDFGNLTTGTSGAGSVSDSHGGLS